MAAAVVGPPTTADLMTAVPRRLHRGRLSCRRIALAVSLLATAFFAFTPPFSSSSTSSNPSFSLDAAADASSNSTYFREFARSSFSVSSRSSNVLNSSEEIGRAVEKLGGNRTKARPLKEERTLPPDEALLCAKREIVNAPLVLNDTELYAPLFRNLSVFKRSYELMERILKVYIYKDGKKPVFHEPELRGIYASEGWFMKLMEEDRRFVVREARKAHLFYIPYSSRQLKNALYVPNSHNLKPLANFLKDHVNNISSVYPFWNRTRGADHFLVACHDWGPYTTTAHEELRKNTIKALCNADTSEGIFVRGRDVSLPETTIRTPNRPQRYVGGKRVSQRTILAFFAGNMHGRVRPTLIKYWGDKDDNSQDMRIYKRLPNRVSRKMSYVEHLKSSKFCLCPMGYEVNSPRIVEAIYAECVPVIIADNFVLPFEEVLDWSSFSVSVAEKDIPNLRDILLGISLRRYIALQAAVKRVQRHFLWHTKPEKLGDNATSGYFNGEGGEGGEKSLRWRDDCFWTSQFGSGCSPEVWLVMHFDIKWLVLELNLQRAKIFWKAFGLEGDWLRH